MKLETKMIFMDGLTEYIIDNCKAVDKMLKLKGVDLTISDINFLSKFITIKDNKSNLTYNLKIRVCHELESLHYQGKLTTFNFKGCKLKKIDKNIVLYDYDFYAVDSTNKQYQKIGTMERFIPNISKVFFLNNIYKTGEYIIYKNEVYRQVNRGLYYDNLSYNRELSKVEIERGIERMLNLDLIS